MARLTMNQAALGQEQQRLKTYQRFLPSLDLKRRQLIAERARARAELAALDAAIEGLRTACGAELPMLACERVDVSDQIEVTGLTLGWENRVGTRLPVLEQVQIQLKPYSRLNYPHWVDAVLERLRERLEHQARREVAEERLQRLEEAVRTITQRVNLFDKVLIPRTQSNIRRIKIFLADAERAAVVRAKIAKTKQRAALT